MKNKNYAGIKNYLALILMTGLVFLLASVVFSFIPEMSSAVPVFVFFAAVQIISMLLFRILPAKKKHISRKISMILMGLTLFLLAGIMGRQNFQLEGFLFMVIGAVFGGPVIHYIMKTAGTLLTGRTWCSWGCWTGLIFDFLPYKNNTSWKSRSFSRIRYYHFFLSAFVVTVLYFAAGYSINEMKLADNGEYVGSLNALYWFITGNVIYYIAGIVLAFIMKDNRAFCKYLCPVAVMLKISNLFALLRIKGINADCSGCGTCEENCPASIRIRDYVRNNGRVLSTECLMCMNCIAFCPEGNLKCSVGFDFVKNEKLNLK